MKKTSVFQNSLIWFGAGVSIAEIPCDRIAIGGKLCVERLCRCDGHSVVQAAARSRRVPALERMTGLDRRARRGGCRRIRLACRGDAGLAINGAAVCSGVPLDRQADRCAHNAQDQAGQTECTAADFVCHKKALLIIVGLVVSGFYLFCVVISF